MSNEKETKVSALDAKAKALANEEDEDTKIAKLLIDFPEPLSPTSAKVCPARSSKLS